MFCVLVKEDMRRALTSLPQVLAESGAKKNQVKILAFLLLIILTIASFERL
jgi:hypothetical protein